MEPKAIRRSCAEVRPAVRTVTLLLLTLATSCSTRSFSGRSATSSDDSEKLEAIFDCSKYGWDFKPVTAMTAPRTKDDTARFSDLLVQRYISSNALFPQTEGAITLHLMEFLARDPLLNFRAGYRALPTEAQVAAVGEAMTRFHLGNGVAKPWEKSDDKVISELAAKARPPLESEKMEPISTHGMRRIGIVGVRSALEALDVVFKNAFAMKMTNIQKVGIYNTDIDQLLRGQDRNSIVEARCQVARVLGKLTKKFSESKAVSALNEQWYGMLKERLGHAKPGEAVRERNDYFAKEMWPKFKELCDTGYDIENGDKQLCEKVWQTVRPFAELLSHHAVP